MPLFIKGDKSILYIHVPKTGGRSILEIFTRNGFRTELLEIRGGVDSLNNFLKCSPQHMHGKLLREILRLERINLIFMTVRNPLDRFKSEFIWHNRRPADDIEKWGASTLDRYAEDPFMLDNHIRPQSEFFVPGAQVFRQEDGFDEKWVASLEAMIDIELPVKSVEPFHDSEKLVGRRSSEIPLSASLKARVEAFYEGDFSQFGY